MFKHRPLEIQVLFWYDLFGSALFSAGFMEPRLRTLQRQVMLWERMKVMILDSCRIEGCSLNSKLHSLLGLFFSFAQQEPRLLTALQTPGRSKCVKPGSSIKLTWEENAIVAQLAEGKGCSKAEVLRRMLWTALLLEDAARGPYAVGRTVDERMLFELKLWFRSVQ